MSERDLIGPLREADRILSAATLSAAARERIAVRLIRDRRRPRLLAPALAVATGVAVAWALWPDRAPARAPAALAGFSWDQAPTCSATERAGALSLDGLCRVVVESLGLSISSRRRAELVRSERGVRLAGGRFEFDVVHRGDRPVEVWVSAGVIEVTGTRFVVEQGRGRGHVDLLEGRIQFRDARGEVTRVEPGSRFVWIDAPAAPRRRDPPPLPDEPRPAPPRVLSSADATSIVERVQALRGGRRYREAVELLRRARGRRWDRHTAEVLSFEEGSLIEHIDHDGACVHWRRHRARFRGGAYRDAVARALTRLDCR